MVVKHHRDNRMASEQPLKKKQRRANDEDRSIEPAANKDEPDFIRSLSSSNNENGGGVLRTDLSELHLTLPPDDVNEDDPMSLDSRLLLNQDLAGFRRIITSGDSAKKFVVEQENGQKTNSNNSKEEQELVVSDDDNVDKKKFDGGCENLAPVPLTADVIPAKCQNFVSSNASNCNRTTSKPEEITTSQQQQQQQQGSEAETFQLYLVRQCLCNIPDQVLRKPFASHQVPDTNGGTRPAMLCEWPSADLLQFLSHLQLLFDVYLKQNTNGLICSRIAQICQTFVVQNDHNLIEQVLSLCQSSDRFVVYMAARVFSSFLIIAKTEVNREWLDSLVGFLTLNEAQYVKMNFALEVIKRVVEWKDVEQHVLEESQDVAGSSSSSSSSGQNVNCVIEPYSDSESYDTAAIKCLIIKSLESKWPDLIERIQKLITTDSSMQAQICILTFLGLWESTISVKANLSVVDIKPFYAHLDKFVGMLDRNLPPIIWKQLLSLFNEVLCYGSTLALQDMLPEDTCQLAHFIVRFVKDHRLLDSIPYRRSQGFTVNSFVGTIPSTQPHQSNIDRTLLQKAALLVLKSAAITIKETRYDSSDSSVGSDDYDFSQDMQHVLRSILDVLKRLDVFIKGSLEFHPETSFSKILVHLFSDQDDYMIEAMVCTCDIIAGISNQNVLYLDFMAMLNPVLSFVEFLSVVSHDSDVLLDYLVSNETCFLLYLLRFLKYVRRNWSHFAHTCTETSGGSRINELDRTMTVLIRLKIQIQRLVSKDLFPYPINPVLRLLEICENQYDGNENS